MTYKERLHDLFEFKKVPGYKIKVNRFGEIIDSKSIKSTYIDKDGYEFLFIKVNKKKTTRKVHRLVAQVFCFGYNKELQVNHKDLDKQNNYYKNLEWCTDKENKIHASLNRVLVGNKGKCNGENNGRSKLTIEQVIDIRFLYSTGLYTQKELATNFSISESMIGNIINMLAWNK